MYGRPICLAAPSPAIESLAQAWHCGKPVQAGLCGGARLRLANPAVAFKNITQNKRFQHLPYLHKGSSRGVEYDEKKFHIDLCVAFVNPCEWRCGATGRRGAGGFQRLGMVA